jgi:hypothetical protein
MNYFPLITSDLIRNLGIQQLKYLSTDVSEVRAAAISTSQKTVLNFS